MKNVSKIETERLILRQLLTSDWKMISFLRSDKEVNIFVDRPPAETKEAAMAFISKISDSTNNKASFYWAITEKPQNNMIGSICLWNFSEDRQYAEVGYDLSPKFQGKGVMAEALKGILAFGFEQLKLKTIEAFTHRLNESSRKLLVRNGFEIVEGKLDADNLDNVVYGIGREVGI